MAQRSQGRSRRSPARTGTRTKQKNRNQAAATQSTFAGGFRLGLLCGVVGTVAVVYAPSLFEAPNAADSSMAAPVSDTAALPDFQFWDILPQDTVGTRARPPETPAPQPSAPQPRQDAQTAARRQPAAPQPAATQPGALFLQAAAFRSRKDAEVMRARLLLEGMAAAIERSPGSGGDPLHHVLVGPFDIDADAQRAAGHLRTLDMAPITVTRPQRS